MGFAQESEAVLGVHASQIANPAADLIDNRSGEEGDEVVSTNPDTV